MQDEAKISVLHRDSRKGVRAELREEGEEEEEEGGEDSLGSQGQLPVVGANPGAHPAAKNHVSHGPRPGEGWGGRAHTWKKQTAATLAAEQTEGICQSHSGWEQPDSHPQTVIKTYHHLHKIQANKYLQVP